jgi:alanine racemase
MIVSSTSTLYVDPDAYRYNLQHIQKLIGDDCAVMPVLKGNAYGHGAIELARVAAEEGVGMLAVATVSEGVELREAFPDVAILTLLQPSEDELSFALEHELHLTLSDLQTAEKVGDLARDMKKIIDVHCELETGMGRQGFQLDLEPKALLNLTRISSLNIEGVYTHFPDADLEDETFTINQIKKFKQFIGQLSKSGISYDVTHAANSAAVLNHPSSFFDMVRPGIITYGLHPHNSVPSDFPFRVVGRWTTRVVLLRELPEGSSISYGRTYTTSTTERIAVLPVGYADGFPRGLSNKGEVIIRGVRCPIRGNITMNEVMVDVSHLPNVATGDVVTLIGSDGDECIRAEELAAHCGTISYEILTGISSRIRREYVSASKGSGVA